MRFYEAVQLAAVAQDNQSLRRVSWRVDSFIIVKKDNTICDINDRLWRPNLEDVLAHDWEVLVPESKFEDDTIYIRKNGETWISIQGLTYKLTCMYLPMDGYKVKSFQKIDVGPIEIKGNNP